MEPKPEQEPSLKPKKVISMNAKPIKVKGLSSPVEKESKPQPLPKHIESHPSSSSAPGIFEAPRKSVFKKPAAQKFRFPGQNRFLEAEAESEDPESISKDGPRVKKQSNRPTETVNFTLEQVTNSSGKTHSIYCFPEVEMHLPMRYSGLLKKPGSEDADDDTDDEQMNLATKKVYSDLKEAVDMNRKSLKAYPGNIRANFLGNLNGQWRSIQERRINEFRNIPVMHPHHRAHTMRSSFMERKIPNPECSTQSSPRGQYLPIFNPGACHQQERLLKEGVKGSTGFLSEMSKGSGIYRERRIGSASTANNFWAQPKEMMNTGAREFSKAVRIKGLQEKTHSNFNCFGKHLETNQGPMIFEKPKWRW